MTTKVARKVQRKSYFISYYGITETVIRISKHLSAALLERGGVNYMTILSCEDDFINLSFSKSGKFGINPNIKQKIYHLSYVATDSTYRVKSKDVLDFSIKTNSSNCKDTVKWHVVEIAEGNHKCINVFLRRQP